MHKVSQLGFILALIAATAFTISGSFLWYGSLGENNGNGAAWMFLLAAFMFFAAGMERRKINALTKKNAAESTPDA